MKYVNWRLIPLLCFVPFAILLWRGLFLNPKDLPSSQINQPMPTFSLPSLLNPQSSFSSKNILHNMVLVNVWASWCPACTEEQLFLLQLAHDGAIIYGLNYKDKPDLAKQWLREWGNPYVDIGEDRAGSVALDFGVYGAPETFLIDKQGIIQYRYAGPLNQAVWQREFLPRMKP